MMPIPKSWLIHSAVLRSPVSADAWQQVTYSDRVLDHVKIEPSTRLVLTKDNLQIQLSSLLIYDCRNSKPVGVDFEPGQKLAWNDREYAVITAEPLYDGVRLHHWEVGLA